MPNATSKPTRLLQHSILMLAATQVGNLANILFQILMNRQLSDMEYGALAAMLGMANIIATPLDALRTAAAHFSARMRQQQQGWAVAGMLKGWLAQLIWPAAAILALGGLGAPFLADFFQMPSAGVIFITALVMALSIFLPALSGALQGMESFGWLAAVAPAWGIGRLAVGAALTAWLAATALMGLTAQAVGILLAVGVAAAGLRKILPRPDPAARPLPRRSARPYLAGAFLVLLGFAVMMTGDVVLVKLFFPPETAGIFARAAGIARAVIFLPAPIAIAMFPKVVAAGMDPPAAHRRTLHMALLYSGILIMAAVAACILAAGPLWLVVTGTAAPPAELLLLRRLAWALAPLGLAYLMLNFEMAQNRFRAAGWQALIAAGYIAGVALFHDTLTQVVAVLAAASCATLAAMAVMVFRRPAVTPAPHRHST